VVEQTDRLRTALSDRYRLDRELGQGGMATVYLAHDLRHEREVAIKVLRPELAATLGPQRFLQEIQIAARLTHPHILPLHDSGEASGFLYYVMPYVEGESLRDKLAREGELPVGESVRILKEVTDALAYAHGRGVVHRDIKPENVMLSGRHALVTDFGVAKALHDATGRQRLTTAGVALGTPAYMAPEQAAADPHMDHRADIYAVGAMGYELLTGRPPFTGSSPQMVLAAQVTEQPRPVTDHRPAVPPALAGTIMRCLEKKPADRWQTAAELLAELEVLASTPSGGITPTSTRPLEALTLQRSGLSQGWKKPALAFVMLAIVVAGAWYATHRPAKLVPGRIVVAPFENQTGDASQDAVGESIVERLTARISGEGMDVVPASAVQAERRHTGESRIEVAQDLSRRTGAEVVVVETAQRTAGGMVYGAELLRMPEGNPIVALDPTAAGEVDVFVERLLVALVMNRESGSEFAWQGLSLPSKLASFQEVRRGDELWVREKLDEAIEAMRRAWVEDSTWFTPLLREVEVLLNAARYTQADTALQRLEERRSRMKGGDRTYLEWLRARVAGDLEAQYQLAMRLGSRMPRTWAGARAWAAVNTHRLEEAVRATDSLRALSYWTTPARRNIFPDWVRGKTLHMLGRHQEELIHAEDTRRLFTDDPVRAITLEIEARAGLHQAAEVERLASEAEGFRGSDSDSSLAFTRAFIAAVELEAHGEGEAARRLYDRAITWHREHTPLATASLHARMMFAWVYHEARKWPEALEIYQGLVREQPQNVEYLWGLGEMLARIGRRGEALQVSEQLAAIKQRYRFGRTTQGRACIAAVLGDKARAVELFRQAEREGATFNPGPHRERCYDGVRDYPPFVEFMRPR